jgi:hypothetical protein
LMKSHNLKGNSKGRSKCQFIPDIQRPLSLMILFLLDSLLLQIHLLLHQPLLHHFLVQVD